MRKHVNRTNGRHTVFLGKQEQITGLCCWIATHVHHYRSFHLKDLGHQFFVHACTGRICDDDIGLSMFHKKLVCTYSCNIACKKMRIGNLVQPGIFMCINDGFFHQLYTNHFFGGITQKNTNAARTAIKIIDRLCAIQQGKILGKLVKPFSLTGIGLKNDLGPMRKRRSPNFSVANGAPW